MTHLCHEDVKVDSHTAPSYIQVRLKASKTDPFRQGVELHLGATGKELWGKRGVPDSLIKMMGRWESTAYMCYMRTAPETLRATMVAPSKGSGQEQN